MSAIAIHEKRQFVNKETNETVKYEVYGIQAIVNGELMELRLKNLDAAEKLAWQMVLTGSDPRDESVASRKATSDESKAIDVRKGSDLFDDDELDELEK